jgi:hypothetical protein
MTIHIPPDLEAPLALAARQQGATPELLAVESLRRIYAPQVEAAHGSLADFLAGYVGTIYGAGDSLSSDTGTRFAELLSQERHGGAP